MPFAHRITLYTASYSPYGQRVRMALEEARADYLVYEIKPHDQPDWFRSKVSPLGKIPAVTFGGPDVPPDQPSPESVKLFESLPLLEFFVDVFPEANFLPADPVLRAKARAFIAIYENYVNNAFIDVLLYRKPVDTLLQGLEKLQATLPPTGFAIGEWSMAEIGVVPFLARLFFYLEHDIGNCDEEGEKKMRDAFASKRFTRLKQYVQEASERPSFKTSWISDEYQLEIGQKVPLFQSRAV
ncbi:thioredoxin-like protein [Cubamyces sp. BRFM 1775]|nr:thioredoxin-like protein [Cubamyces sp. BRFM 1775]